jgi:hypothetical protein
MDRGAWGVATGWLTTFYHSRVDPSTSQEILMAKKSRKKKARKKSAANHGKRPNS